MKKQTRKYQNHKKQNQKNMQTSKNQQETWKTQQTTPKKKQLYTPNTHMDTYGIYKQNCKV